MNQEDGSLVIEKHQQAAFQGTNLAQLNKGL